MQSGLISLELVARLNQVPMDTRAVAREFALGDAEPIPSELVRILKRQGFRTSLKKLPLHKLEQYPLPAIARLDSGKYIVILKLKTAERKLMVFISEGMQTQEMEPVN